ncbi:MAG: ECF transporter S component [Eubacterium sp.]|nr:ECF transporter S component [Eubacterium sp.]
MKRIITWLVVIISLVLTVIWQLVFKEVNYYIICAVMLLLSTLPFFIRFEGEKTSAREISLIATLIALAVASRAAFYLIPQVKPIAAVVVISAVCLGAEKGYLIGAFSAFVSNFLFGQGFWTPFQMAALGLVGLISGLIFKAVKPNRYSLSLVGFILSFAVYGFVTDISTVLMSLGGKPTLSGAIAIFSAGVPFSLVFGITTAVFLFLFGEVFIKKIGRIQIKYID